MLFVSADGSHDVQVRVCRDSGGDANFVAEDRAVQIFGNRELRMMLMKVDRPYRLRYADQEECESYPSLLLFARANSKGIMLRFIFIPKFDDRLIVGRGAEKAIEDAVGSTAKEELFLLADDAGKCSEVRDTKAAPATCAVLEVFPLDLSETSTH